MNLDDYKITSAFITLHYILRECSAYISYIKLKLYWCSVLKETIDIQTMNCSATFNMYLHKLVWILNCLENRKMPASMNYTTATPDTGKTEVVGECDPEFTRIIYIILWAYMPRRLHAYQVLFQLVLCIE